MTTIPSNHHIVCIENCLDRNYLDFESILKKSGWLAVRKRTLLFTTVILLVTLSNIDYTYSARNYAKSGNQVISTYIEGYLKNDYEKIIFSDLHIMMNFLYKVNTFPKPFKEEEADKEIDRISVELKDMEQKKLSKGTSLTTPRRLIQQKADGSGMNLLFILYPKMKYEILEVRDTPMEDTILRADDSAKMAFVKMSYLNPESAPFLDQKRNSKIKDMIVKVYLAIDEANQYFVSGYFPTDYKRELYKIDPKANPSKILKQSEKETSVIEINDLDKLRAETLQEAREIEVKNKIDTLYKNALSAAK